MEIPLQEKFLYKGKWLAESDVVLVQKLFILKSTSTQPFALSEYPTHALVAALNEVGATSGVCFGEADVETRIRFLDMRYKTFQQVVAEDGARWKQAERVVAADDDVWKSIFKKNKFDAAYYYVDEPIFNELDELFGMPDIKMEDEQPVIELSDNTTVIELSDNTLTMTEELISIDAYGMTEEVDSPMLPADQKAKRKLFVGEGFDDDRDSTSAKPALFLAL